MEGDLVRGSSRRGYAAVIEFGKRVDLKNGIIVNSGQPSGLRAILLGLVFYKTLKLTSTFTSTGTGLPSTVAGLNRYLLTASTAFSSNPLPKARTT
jgi:hypothetical protein